jgi:hypothetical protein
LATATAGIGIIDLSNTGIAANSQPFLWGGGFFLRSGVGVLSNLTWAQMCAGPSPGGVAGAYATDCGIHALTRRDAVMYTSPTWQGFTFAGAFGEDDFWDVAGRYAGEWFGFRVAAGIGYRWYSDREADAGFPPGGPFIDEFRDTERRHWLSSASVMHVASGLFISGAYLRYSFDGLNGNELFDLDPGRNRPDVPLWWVGGGIEKNWTGLGGTTFYAEYGNVGDGITGLRAVSAGLVPVGAAGVVVDSEMSWWGLGAVQKIDTAAMDLYLAYRRYSADIWLGDSAAAASKQITGGLEDIWYIQAGARIQF